MSFGVKVSEKRGAGVWIRERASSIALVPLTLWALVAGVSLIGRPHAEVAAWAAEPLNATLMAVTLAISIYHMHLGVTVVIEDYLRRASERAMRVLNAAGCLILAAAGLYFIVSLAGA